MSEWRDIPGYTVSEIELEKVEGGVRYYKAITVNFIPIDPQLIPA